MANTESDSDPSPDDKIKERAKEIAIRYCDQPDQAAVAAAMRLSAATVSRALRIARDERYLIEKPVLNLEAADEARIRRRAGLSAVDNGPTQRLWKWANDKGFDKVRHVRVIDCESGPDASVHSWHDRMRLFAGPAAVYLNGLFQTPITLGLNWGPTYLEIGTELKRLRVSQGSPTFTDDFVCFATLGTLISGPRKSSPEDKEAEHLYQISAGLVPLYSRILNAGVLKNHYPLLTTPPLIPELTPAMARSFEGLYKGDKTPPNFESIRDAYLAVCKQSELVKHEYAAVFDEENGLVEKMDAILTVVGPTRKTTEPGPNVDQAEFWEKTLIDGGLSKEMSHLCGHFGGVPIPWRGDPESEAAKDSVLKRWLGIREEHYKKCAAGARSNPSRPGVIVCAVGAARAQSVYWGLQNSLITELLVDRQLWTELEQNLGNPKFLHRPRKS